MLQWTSRIFLATTEWTSTMVYCTSHLHNSYSCAHTCATSLYYVVIHCRFYHMEVNSNKRIKSETESFNLNSLSTSEFFVSDRPPYGSAYSRKVHFCVLHCKHFHMEVYCRQTAPSGTKTFSLSFLSPIEIFVSDWSVYLGLTSIWYRLQRKSKRFVFCTVSITVWKSVRDKKCNQRQKFQIKFLVVDCVFVSDWQFCFEVASIC